MSEALGEEAFAEIDTRRRADAALAEMRAKGVREGSLRIVERLLAEDAKNGPAGETSGGWTYNPIVEAYMPETDANGHVLGDEPALLRRRLASPNPPSLEVRFRATDGRDERLSFSAVEPKRYLEGDLELQESMRTFAVRERRLKTAIAAAAHLRESGGRRAEIELGGATLLTPDQELCLREFAGITTATKYAREGGVRTAREAIVLREGWHTKAARALREGARDLDPAKLREDWGFDDDLASEQEPRPRIGGLVGPGNRSDFAAAARLGIMWGPNEQQMLASEVWNEQWKARTAYATDPFCKQGVRISSNFVLGRGLSVTAKNPKVQAVLDEYDGRHSQASKKKHLRSALVMGEVFLWR
ncbi:MAG: hypothetical protein IAI48_00450 [Candidatus Eremiobacteraeota bacterium]|nr:hypothetical protein [Candidatus Eremiobacteraeota bacterium]